VWVLTNHCFCWKIVLQELERVLQDNPLFTITFTNTVPDLGVSPNDILSTFIHADVTNVEGDGVVYGSLQVKYFNVVDLDCYDAAGDVGTPAFAARPTRSPREAPPLTPRLPRRTVAHPPTILSRRSSGTSWRRCSTRMPKQSWATRPTWRTASASAC
jgi:hypothetical protein